MSTLREYAKFLQEQHFDEFTKETYRRSIDAKQATSATESKFEVDIDISHFREGATSFIKEIIEGSFDSSQIADPKEIKSAQSISTSPGLHADYLNISSDYWRHSFLHFLPHFTKDLLVGIDILKELEDFLQKKTDLKLLEKTRTFQNILDSIPVFVFWKDKTNRLLGFNEAYQKALNRSKEELLTKTAEELYPDAEKYLVDDYEVMNSGKPKLNIVESVFTPEGTFWAKTDKVPLRDKNGEIIGIIGSAIDITELVKTQEELHNLNAELERRVEERTKEVIESERRFQTLAESLPAIVWTALPNGQVDYLSKKWTEYTGRTVEEALGKGWVSMVHPEQMNLVLERWEEALKEGKELIVECQLKTKNHTYKWMLSKAVALEDSNGNIVKWFGTSTEIEDQKRFVEELNVKNMELTKINNDLDNFVYTASHDLKAPVSNMEGLMSILLESVSEETLNSEEFKFVTDRLIHSIERFKTTILDLTEISRAQRTVFEEAEVIDVRRLIDEVRLDLEVQIRETNTSISIDTIRCETISFSIKNLRSIIFNLLNNAIKYRSPNRLPEITIMTYSEGRHSIVEVRDNGLGIKNEQVDKIFQMFKRLHTHVEGSGVGLYIVKRIIDNVGGKIEVQTELEKGSSFKIYLPTQR